jgi:hypothetical protein
VRRGAGRDRHFEREHEHEYDETDKEAIMSEKSLLPSSWEVPQVFRDRLGARVGRQRAMTDGGHLLLVLHEPPRPGEDERRGRFIWRRPDGSWTSKGLGDGTAAVERHVEEYAHMVDELETMEERAEGSDAYFGVVRAAGPLHHAAGNLHATLQQARELFPADRDLIDFRDRAYQVHRRAELLYTLAKDGLDFATAQQSERLARDGHRMSLASHRLNLLAAFFFPMATLSSVFGMQLVHGYEGAYAPVPFLATIAVGLGFGCILAAVIARAPAGGAAAGAERRARGIVGPPA